MTLNEVQDQIVEEFSVFDEWLDKYDYLIELSKELPPIDEKHRTEQYVIKGCQSRVWVDAKMHDGQEEILGADLYFIDRIGLRENLSPTRANGLLAMIKQMKLYALAFQNKKP